MSAAYKGKEQIYIDSDSNSNYEEAQIETKPAVRVGQFRFMDLPAELRVHIYSFLLPHNLIISHDSHCKGSKRWHPHWRINTTTKKTGKIVPIATGHEYGSRRWRYGQGWVDNPSPIEEFHVETQLFRVSKEILGEARG